MLIVGVEPRNIMGVSNRLRIAAAASRPDCPGMFTSKMYRSTRAGQRFGLGSVLRRDHIVALGSQQR